MKLSFSLPFALLSSFVVLGCMAPGTLWAQAATKAAPQPAASKPATQNATPSTAKLDPAMDVNKAAANNLSWHDVTQWGVEGRILPDQERTSWFDRLPASANGKVTSNVWNLSRDSAGMMVRFKTNSPSIHVQYKLTKANIAMPHMPATGVSGVDLYARDTDGKWKWVQVTKPAAQEVKAEIIKGLAPVNASMQPICHCTTVCNR